jgi:hypothetical protein
MLKVVKLGGKANTINHMIVVDAIVRNDEVVGSIPTSSTIFQSLTGTITLNSVPFCSENLSLPRSLPLQVLAGFATDSQYVPPLVEDQRKF